MTPNPVLNAKENDFYSVVTESDRFRSIFILCMYGVMRGHACNNHFNDVFGSISCIYAAGPLTYHLSIKQRLVL